MTFDENLFIDCIFEEIKFNTCCLIKEIMT